MAKPLLQSVLSRTLAFVAVVAIVLGLPITIFLAQQQTNTEQNAAGPSDFTFPLPSGTCVRPWWCNCPPGRACPQAAVCPLCPSSTPTFVQSPTPFPPSGCFRQGGWIICPVPNRPGLCVFIPVCRLGKPQCMILEKIGPCPLTPTPASSGSCSQINGTCKNLCNPNMETDQGTLDCINEKTCCTPNQTLTPPLGAGTNVSSSNTANQHSLPQRISSFFQIFFH